MSDVTITAEPVLSTSYVVSDYADEVPPHGPTIEEAAQFLLVGFKADEGLPATSGPLANHRDIIELSCLDHYADRVAIKHNGVWRLEPPPPADADFFAVRFGPGLGWSAEDIFSSPATFADDLADTLEDDDTEIGHIAVCRQRDELRLFMRSETSAALHELSDAETIEALWRKFYEARSEAFDLRMLLAQANSALKAAGKPQVKELADDAAPAIATSTLTAIANAEQLTDDRRKLIIIGHPANLEELREAAADLWLEPPGCFQQANPLLPMIIGAFNGVPCAVSDLHKLDSFTIVLGGKEVATVMWGG